MRSLLCAVVFLVLSQSSTARMAGAHGEKPNAVSSVFALPTVTTGAFANVSFTTATLNGNVTANGGVAVLERGFAWNTSPAPTTAQNKIVAGDGTGIFSKAFAGPFPPNTTIYVRAFATNAQGTSYGSQISFTTASLAGTSATYDFEPASGTLSGFDTHTVTATHTASSSSLAITAAADYVFRSSEWGLNDNVGHIGSEGLYFGLNDYETSVTFTMQGGKSFDLTSFYLTHEINAPIDYTISTSKGSFVIPYPEPTSVLPYDYIDIAGNANAAFFNGIKSFTITAAPGSFFEIDNLVMQNISGSTLPVTLINFTAQLKNDDVQLEWHVADETAFRQYEIERTVDGTDFSKIGVVTAVDAGNDSYSFTDKMPLASTVFYRLKMVDMNGSFTYSRLVGIRPDASFRIELFPNPVVSALQLSLPPTAGGMRKIIVLNGHGQILQTKVYDNPGAMIVSIDVAGLAAGKYLVQIVQANASVTRQFIKQ